MYYLSMVIIYKITIDRYESCARLDLYNLFLVAKYTMWNKTSFKSICMAFWKFIFTSRTYSSLYCTQLWKEIVKSI